MLTEAGDGQHDDLDEGAHEGVRLHGEGRLEDEDGQEDVQDGVRVHAGQRRVAPHEGHQVGEQPHQRPQDEQHHRVRQTHLLQDRPHQRYSGRRRGCEINTNTTPPYKCVRMLVIVTVTLNTINPCACFIFNKNDVHVCACVCMPVNKR